MTEDFEFILQNIQNGIAYHQAEIQQIDECVALALKNIEESKERREYHLTRIRQSELALNKLRNST